MSILFETTKPQDKEAEFFFRSEDNTLTLEAGDQDHEFIFPLTREDATAIRDAMNDYLND